MRELTVILLFVNALALIGAIVSLALTRRALRYTNKRQDQIDRNLDLIEDKQDRIDGVS